MSDLWNQLISQMNVLMHSLSVYSDNSVTAKIYINDTRETKGKYTPGWSSWFTMIIVTLLERNAALGFQNCHDLVFVIICRLFERDIVREAFSDQLSFLDHCVRTSLSSKWHSKLVIEQEYMRSLKTSGGLTKGGGMTECEQLLLILSRPTCLSVNLYMQGNLHIQRSACGSRCSKKRAWS